MLCIALFTLSNFVSFSLGFLGLSELKLNCSSKISWSYKLKELQRFLMKSKQKIWYRFFKVTRRLAKTSVVPNLIWFYISTLLSSLIIINHVQYRKL